MAFGVYSLSAVPFIFGGAPATGYGEGGAFKISFKREKFTAEEGVDGGVMRSYTGSKLAEVTLTLLQNSPYNDYLSAIGVADELASDLAQGGSGVLPFLTVDGNGTTYAKSPTMWITKVPDLTRTNKNSDVEWVFNAANMKVFIGGSISL